MMLRKFCCFFTALMVVPSVSKAQEEIFDLFWADTVTVEAQRMVTIPRLNAVATKMLIPLHSTPASVGVVTRAVFEGQQGITLRDALKNISGVNVTSGSSTFDFFLIRGFESLTGGMVLTDGAAEPEVSFYNLYNIERIEALKGPAAFLYGGNPLSGAVNLVRKQPVFSNFANFSGSYGEFQTYRGTFDVGVSDPSSSVAFRFNGLWQDSENYRDDKNNKVYAFNPALTWQINDRSSVTVNFEYVDSEYAPDAGLPLQFNPVSLSEFDRVVPGVPRTNSYQTQLDDSNQEEFRVRLDYNRTFSNFFSLRNKFYFTQLDWVSMGTILNGAFPNAQGSFGVNRALSSLDDRQRFVGNQLEAVLSFETGSVRHNLLTGFEAARFSDDFGLDAYSLLQDIDLFNPVESITSIDQLQFNLLAQSNRGDARSLIFAPYVLNRTSFSEKVQLFFGGRLDIIDYKDDRTDGFLDQTTFGFNEFPSENSRDYTRLSPMAGLVISPNSSLSFYANAGHSFRPPSVLVIGAPKPEESTQFEFGTKVNAWDGDFTSNLAVYRIERENIGIPDQTGVTQQTGNQRSVGFEFEVAAQPVRGWHTFFNYAFTDAELTDFREVDFITMSIADRSGNRAAFSPK
ncbi:TonB-dependent receptor, partial [bacterium]|nr:TonB-dependent receptor [bacterium]